MSNTIQIKRSTNSGSTPTTLAAGELAVNTADKTLFVGDGSNVVELIGSSLTDINGLTPSNNYFIVGNGSNFVAEPPTDARTSLGLLALATKNNVNLASSEVTGILTVDHGGTGINTVRENAILKGDNDNALIASGVSIDSNDKLNLAEEGIAFDQYGADPTSSYGAGTMFYSSGGSLKFSTDGTVLKQIAYTSDITKTTVSGNGVISTAGSPLTGGQATETFDINAVSTNTINSIVYRDGSGDFAAGTITASLTGNASTATKWETGRTITLGGDLTGNVSIDGSANVTLTATVAANSVELGTNTTGNYVGTITAGTGLSSTGATTGEDISHTISLSHLGIQNLSNPGADRVIFWDNSEGSTEWLTLGSNLTISGTTLNATDTNTTYSAGTGLNLTGTTFSIDSTVLTSSSTIDGGTF